MKIIHTENAPAAIGPYSQAVDTGSQIFLSGQLGLNPQTMTLEDGIENQTKRSLNNINEVLRKAGYEKSGIIKMTIFLKNLSDFEVVNKIYSEFLENHKPARSTVEVSALPKGALIEIEAIGGK